MVIFETTERSCASGNVLVTAMRSEASRGRWEKTLMFLCWMSSERLTSLFPWGSDYSNNGCDAI